MKKILAMVTVAMLMTSAAWASFVHLTKPGTDWVWRVEAGMSATYLGLESGDDILLEDGQKILVYPENSGEALYNSLIGQGWVTTDLPSNIPQGLSEGEAASYGLALLEDDTTFALEDGNQLKLEN